MKKAIQLLALAVLVSSFAVQNVCAKMMDVQSAEELLGVIAEGGPVVVKFHANWCGACRGVKEAYDTLGQAGDLGMVTFAQVDVDKVRDIPGHAPVTALPTFRYYQGGEQKKQVVGAARNFDESVRTILQNELGIEGVGPKMVETEKPAAPRPEGDMRKPVKAMKKEAAPAQDQASAGGIMEQILGIVSSILKIIQDLINAIVSAIGGLFGGK